MLAMSLFSFENEPSKRGAKKRAEAAAAAAHQAQVVREHRQDAVNRPTAGSGFVVAFVDHLAKRDRALAAKVAKSKAMKADSPEVVKGKAMKADEGQVDSPEVVKSKAMKADVLG